MQRTIVLLAGLGAALLTGGLAAVRGEATPDTNQLGWVEQYVQEVTPGQTYRLDGCLTVTGTGVMSISLSVAWYEQPGGFGATLYQDDAHADVWRVGKQCLSLTTDAPCAARSARYGVLVKGDTGAVSVDSPTLQFSAEPNATPIACPTKPPSPTATPMEPTVFPSLVNGGFEDVREDGTPYGWRKIGGEMSASNAFHAEGGRSAALVSRTASTKWIYQTVSVQGGAFYRLRAAALKNDPAVREALLRVSWYESADGSGSQIGTGDSPALVEGSPAFVMLDTGPVQAPPQAGSAKVRLLLRPASAASAVVYFDAVQFGQVDAPTPTAVLTPSPASTPGQAASPDPSPPEPVPTTEAAEPRVFPSLVNGGFEDVREDDTPYGWRKIGGEMSASNAFHAEGGRSAALVSRTASTKWIYQTVSIQGGAFYRLQAAALKNDPGVREALLRVSWYESADGSGSQIAVADSPALAEDSADFVTLDTDPVQAPLEARSAKVRLLMRPTSAASAAVYFDDVRFDKTGAPAATDTPTVMDTQTATSAGGSEQTERPSAGRSISAAAGWSPEARQVEAAALGASRKPTTLANVRHESAPEAASDAEGGRPLWPLLLAFGVPGVALGTLAGHAWWRARLTGRKPGHLS